MAYEAQHAASQPAFCSQAPELSLDLKGHHPLIQFAPILHMQAISAEACPSLGGQLDSFYKLQLLKLEFQHWHCVAG